MSNTTFTCAQCGAVHPVSQRHMVQGDALCETCFNMEAFLCSRCGTPVYCDNNAGDTSTPLCEDCFHHCSFLKDMFPRLTQNLLHQFGLHLEQ